MNLRPSGYEPDELPGCSTPRQGDGREESGCGGSVRSSGLAVTYSPASWDAVPSARRRLTAEFGMGSGVSLALLPPNLESPRTAGGSDLPVGRGSPDRGGPGTRSGRSGSPPDRTPLRRQRRSRDGLSNDAFASDGRVVRLRRATGSAVFRIGSKPVGRLVPVS